MSIWIQELMDAYFYFMIYAFGGWVAQGIWVGFKNRRFVNTGFFRGPWVPIFGIGCLLIIYVIDPISRNPFWVFFNTFWITSVLEYVTSWALQKMYHRLWWDYSKRPFNIHGRVCLLNSVMYGLAGLVITFGVQPWIAALTARIPAAVFAGIEIVYSLFFWSDVISTLIEMEKHKKSLEVLHKHVQSLISEAGERQKQHLEAARKALQTAEANSRHLHGMVHQKLEAAYQNSLDELRRLNDQNG